MMEQQLFVVPKSIPMIYADAPPYVEKWLVWLRDNRFLETEFLMIDLNICYKPQLRF